MLGSLLLASSLLAQGAGPRTVTYTANALPARVALAELSQKAGVQLCATPAVGEELLLLRFHDVPVDVVLEKIAGCATASWQRDGDTYTLSRPPELVGKVAKELRDEARAVIANTLAKRVADLGSSPAWSADSAKRLAQAVDDIRRTSQQADSWQQTWPKAMKIRNQSPSGRLLTKLLQLLGPDTLVNLPVGARTVFATSPTRMQRPFPPAAANLLVQYAREQALWGDALQQLGPTDEESDMYGFFDLSEADKAKKTPAKVLLVVTTDDSSESVGFQLRVADAAGSILSQNDSYVGMEDVEAPAPKPLENPAAGEKALDLPKLLTDYWAFANWRKDPTEASPSPELREYLLDPVVHEPLALVPGLVLLAAAEAKDVNIALCLEEENIQNFSFRTKDLKPTIILQRAVRQLRKGALQDGWLTGCPSRPLTAVSKREDRKILRRFIQTADREGRISLDNLSAYAQTSTEGFFESLGFTLGSVVLGDRPDPTFGADWNYLRLYGSLSQVQKKTLLEGGKIPFSNLTPGQRAVVNKIVFGSELTSSAMSDSLITEDEFGEMNSLLTEPTEVLPNGLDPEGWLTMKLDQSPVLFAYDGYSSPTGSYDMPPQAMDFESIAMTIAAKDHKELFPWVETSSTRGYRTGTRKKYDIRLIVTPRAYSEGSLEDNTMAKGPLLQLDQLPQDTQKVIREKVAELAKQYEGMKGFPSGTKKTVPPPR